MLKSQFCHYMPGIFRKLFDFLIGKSKIDAYGGEKGGFSYLILYDTTTNEVLGNYVTAPQKMTKKYGGSGSGYGVNIGANYQSDVEKGQTFVIENKSKTSTITTDQVTPKINEYYRSMNKPEIKPTETHQLAADKSFIAGQYQVPVAPNNIEDPTLGSHFGKLSQGSENGLNMIPEFVVSSFWGDSKNYRSCIFLHNAIDKELNMYATYHMTGHVDYMMSLKDGTGTSGLAYKNKRPSMADFGSGFTHEDRGIKSSDVWNEMQSMLAVPILDSDEVALGVLSVDSSDGLATSKFNNKDLNVCLQILCRSLGRILEGYGI